MDELEIELDSLSRLRAICNLSEKYEDINWHGIRTADLLEGILIRLRTRPARTTFKWVQGHEDNYGNIRADRLANEGRESNSENGSATTPLFRMGQDYRPSRVNICTMHC